MTDKQAIKSIALEILSALEEHRQESRSRQGVPGGQGSNHQNEPGCPGGYAAVVGSINADLTVETARLPKPGETVIGGPLATLPGGKSANQAVTSALLGAATSFIGAVGRDTHGDMLYQSLRRAGVDTTGVQRVDQPSGSTLITVDSRGENTIVYSAGANATLSADVVSKQAEIIRQAKVLGLCLESPLDAVEAAADIAHNAGVTVVLNFSPLREVSPSLLQLVDVLIVNEHELAVLANRIVDASDHAGLRDALSGLGFARIVLTLGADGALVLEDGEFTVVPSFQVEAVDTTGCGDAFMGSLLAALAAGESLSRGACLASAVAGAAALRRGAQSSYRNAAEVREFLG